MLKTILAVNPASFLSQRYETLLVDLDVEEPDDYLFFPGSNLNGVDQYKMISAFAWSGHSTKHIQFQA